MFTRKLLRDLLTNLVAFVFIFAIFSFVWVWTVGDAPVDFLWAILPFFALMWVREHVRNFYVFIGIHLILAALPAVLALFVFSNAADFVAPLSVLSVCISVFSISKRFGVNTETTPWTAVSLVAVLGGLLILLNAFELYPEGYGVTALMSGLVLIGICAVIMQVQMAKMDVQIALLGDRVKNSPKGVVRSNYIIMCGFLGIVMIFGVAAILVPDSAMAAGLMFAAQAAFFVFTLPFLVLGFIGSFFYSDYVATGEELELPALYGYGYYVPYMPPEIYEEPEPYYEGTLVSDIFAVVGIVIAGIVLVFILIALYKAMKNRFGRKKSAGGTDFEAEKLEMELKKRGLFAKKDKTLRHPVRRAYRKKVNNHIKKGASVYKHHHHENIADIVRENEDIDELTKKYEVVRYGRQG